ncbi:MAG: phosphotransferase [Bacteroidota bacterium]
MDTLKHQFHQLFPNSYFLETDLQGISQFLLGKGWLQQGESLERTEKPGEGNMNYVLRVRTNKRSFILKQARPWVEKYPQIAAPVERNQVEATYFQEVAHDPFLRKYSPELIAMSPEHFMMMLGDLGEGVDYMSLYKNDEKVPDEEIQEAVNYLSSLHKISGAEYPDNQAMRVLNHEHIFHFPFLEDNGMDLDTIFSGLQESSLAYRKNTSLKEKITQLGEKYLSRGSVLVHGDFYPGSWLKTSEGLKVIDPEFSFPGMPEFDLGVLVAHMVLSEQDQSVIHQIPGWYSSSNKVDESLLCGFAGTEILRRILGVAQLPLEADLPARVAMMQLAEKWIMTGKLN